MTGDRTIDILLWSTLPLILGCMFKPVRKAIGLVGVIVGIMACLTGIGLIVGLPSIFIGAVFLFS